MIRRFYADNFRCLVNFEFKPERVNLILGRNGSGKSTLFDAIRAVVQLMSGSSLQTTLPLESLPWWEVRRQQTFELDLVVPAGDEFQYRVVVRQSEREPPLIVEEHLKLGGKAFLEFANGALELPGVAKSIPFDGKQSALALGLGAQGPVQTFLNAVARLLIFRLNPWSMDLQARDEERILWTSGGNLVAFLRAWSQTDPEAFVDWKRRVLAGMPYLEDIQLRELMPGSRMLTGMRHVGGRERLLSLANFSEGERALLALHAIAGLADDGGMIGLDEPDNFLAPSEVQPVLRLFTLTPPSGSAAQLFVVTHHPSSIDYLAAYATWLFERNDDGFSRVRKLEFDRDQGERPTDSLLAELSA
jgi:predicted ATPase